MAEFQGLTEFYNQVMEDATAGAGLTPVASPNEHVKIFVGRDRDGKILVGAVDAREYLDHPERVKITHHFADRDSLVRYARPFTSAAGGATPRLYANHRPRPSERAMTLEFFAELVLDDNLAEHDPQNREHVARMQVGMDPRFAKWYRTMNKWITRGDFAELIDDSIDQVRSPSHADLLELIQVVKGKRTTQFEDGERLANGQRSLATFEEITVNGGGRKKGQTVAIPEALVLECPVLEGGDPRKFSTRLRHRVTDDNQVEFKLLLADVETFLTTVWREYVAGVEEELGLEAVYVR